MSTARPKVPIRLQRRPHRRGGLLCCRIPRFEVSLSNLSLSHVACPTAAPLGLTLSVRRWARGTVEDVNADFSRGRAKTSYLRRKRSVLPGDDRPLSLRTAGVWPGRCRWRSVHRVSCSEIERSSHGEAFVDLERHDFQRCCRAMRSSPLSSDLG